MKHHLTMQTPYYFWELVLYVELYLCMFDTYDFVVPVHWEPPLLSPAFHRKGWCDGLRIKFITKCHASCAQNLFKTSLFGSELSFSTLLFPFQQKLLLLGQNTITGFPSRLMNQGREQIWKEQGTNHCLYSISKMTYEDSSFVIIRLKHFAREH